MKYIIDIDGTICTKTRDNNYEEANPYKSRIELVNHLYDNGHEIHFWTARGSSSGKDWSELTKKQLKEWGVKYTTLELGKPSYDVWIDDKAINSEDYFDDTTDGAQRIYWPKY